MPNPHETAEYVKLLTGCQRRLYIHILSLLPDPTEAEELLQQTNVVLWEKASDFQPGTSFGAWACRVAYFEVLAHRNRLNRKPMTFSSELLETMSEEFAVEEPVLDQRRSALAGCIKKLRDGDRDLVSARYAKSATAAEIAVQFNRPLNSIYRSLERIRLSLLECIQKSLSTEDA